MKPCKTLVKHLPKGKKNSYRFLLITGNLGKTYVEILNMSKFYFSFRNIKFFWIFSNIYFMQNLQPILAFSLIDLFIYLFKVLKYPLT